MNYRKILADNVRALKARYPELRSNAKIARRCKSGNRKIGASTIAHLIDDEAGVWPKLDTIIAVAEAFKVTPPWLLLTPNFDPDKKTSGDMPSPEIIQLALRILTIPRPEQALLMRIFSQSVPEEAIGEMRAPITIQQSTKIRDYERAARRRR